MYSHRPSLPQTDITTIPASVKRREKGPPYSVMKICAVFHGPKSALRKVAGKSGIQPRNVCLLCRMGNKGGIKVGENDDQPCYLTSIAVFVAAKSRP